MSERITFPYKAFEKVAYRVPTLSIEELYSILQNMKGNSLPQLTPHIEEGIYLASPVLHTEILKLLNGEIKDSVKRGRIIDSYIKYISRMATRCTPFGVFASCSVGSFGGASEYALCKDLIRCTRLDMLYLGTLSQTLSSLPDIKAQLYYYSNNTIYKVAGRLRYIEFKNTADKILHTVTSVQSSKFLLDIISKSKSGITFNNLIDWLEQQSIARDDAEGFINELITSKILISELEVTTTGESFLDKMIKTLTRVKLNEVSKNILYELGSINLMLKELDSFRVNKIEAYKEVVKKITSLNAPFRENYIFQVDVSQTHSKVTLGPHIVKELESVVSFFAKTAPSISNNSLNKFKDAFSQRYEGQEVPLSLVLDPELGLGYPVRNGIADVSPLVESLVLPQSNASRHKPLKSLSSLLTRKIQSGLPNLHEIVISPDEIELLPEDYSKLSSTIYVMFQVLKDKDASLLLHVKGIGCGSAARLLTRFAHLDSNMEDFVKDIVDKEKAYIKDGIVAEIVHLPSARVGNILSRPHIRDYEITYLSNSDLPEANKIQLDDLMLSYKEGKLVLRSKRLDIRVLPQLTSAHNYHNDTLPVYRFLCDMQSQDIINGAEFDLSTYSSWSEYQPRLKFGNTIFSLRKWIIQQSEVMPLLKLDNEELLTGMDDWRRRRNIPILALLSDSDNELYIDFTCIVSIKSFFSSIRKKTKFTLKEFLFTKEDLVVQGKAGHYVNEFVATFYRD